jgi:hypothetical protein
VDEIEWAISIPAISFGNYKWFVFAESLKLNNLQICPIQVYGSSLLLKETIQPESLQPLHISQIVFINE